MNRNEGWELLKSYLPLLRKEAGEDERAHVGIRPRYAGRGASASSVLKELGTTLRQWYSESGQQVTIRSDLSSDAVEGGTRTTIPPDILPTSLIPDITTSPPQRLHPPVGLRSLAISPRLRRSCPLVPRPLVSLLFYTVPQNTDPGTPEKETSNEPSHGYHHLSEFTRKSRETAQTSEHVTCTTGCRNISSLTSFVCNQR
ncbi:hypothetical protein Bbelb_024870 [Branchiostoma belcheri]|nr:hypothetical protein Bbelb_024870 [Branchiostoma belcheri]